MKKLFALVLACIMSCSVMAINIWDGSSEPWTNGTGTAEDPYLIETAAHLAYLAEKVNEGYQAQGMEVFAGVHFLMTDDFDLDNLNWTPIGNANMSMQGFYFVGVFDGWYHNIDHLRIQSDADATALFAGLGGDGVIQRLSVTNGNITSTGTGVSGIVCGMSGNSMVYQCSFSGTISVTNNGSYCGGGGIVGACMEYAQIIECSFHGSITATNNGGFMGAAGAGGIVGAALNNTSIQSCYSTGSILANATMLSAAAGIVGATLQDNNVKVNGCYNVGSLNAFTKGGIFGMVSPINPFKGERDIQITNCYYLNTCGGSNSYGTSMTAEQMRTEEFKDQLDQGSHVFVMGDSINDGYPIHSLVAACNLQATDVTCHSAKLCAQIHQGNDSVARAYFLFRAWGEEEWIEFDVPTEGDVEVELHGLEPETFYEYGLELMFADSIIKSANLGSFYTLVYDALEDQSQTLTIYPNPATDFVTIQGVMVSEVQVFNLKGQLVKTVRGSNEVDVTDLPESVYSLRIIDGFGETFSVIIVKAN